MEKAAKDLAEDKARLVALYTSALKRLRALERELERTEANYLPLTHGALLNQTKNFSSHMSRALDDLQTGEFSIQKKKEYGDLLRVLDAGVASLLSAANWQSPSFWHTQTPQAGRETGAISVSQNDYKRDMHMGEKQYGKEFVQAYIDHPLRLAPFAYPTSSGMSAVTTVLMHLQNTVGASDVVLAGKSSYFQNKWQLEKLFPGRVRYVDEFDTEEILTLVKELQPPIIFLDSLCGAESLPMPDLHTLVPRLSNLLSGASTLVLDNTGLSTMYQPLRDLPINPLGMRVIVVESLLKFHQFGFDRVGGGIIWAPVGSERGLFETRMHLGTVMPDASVAAMPGAHRALFDARLLRIGRNAKLLAQLLQQKLEGKGIAVNHPGLEHYKGYAWTKKLPFQGPFVTLTFPEDVRDVSYYDKFVSRVQKTAQERGVDLVGGTSFGFDTTRLYVTARYATNITEPFVRISVGTETEEEIEQLAEVFARAL